MTTLNIPFVRPGFQVRVHEPSRATALPQVGPQTLDNLLRDFPYLPPQAAVLGMCTDGNPILLNLADPAPAALLIAAQPASGKTDLLKSALRSVIALNTPRQVQAVILANDPGEWDDVVKSNDPEYFMAVNSAYDRQAGNLVMELAATAEARRYGRQTGPTVLLLVDNLRNLARQDYDATVNLEWLLQNGAASRVWPIAAMNTQSARELEPWMRRFRTRLLGRVDDAEVARMVSGSPNPPMIKSRGQFATRIAQQWRLFWTAQ